MAPPKTRPFAESGGDGDLGAHLLREMTRGEVPCGLQLELGFDVGAHAGDLRDRAARVKATSRRRVERRRDLTRQLDQPAPRLDAWVGHWDGGEERPSVRVLL